MIHIIVKIITTVILYVALAKLVSTKNLYF